MRIYTTASNPVDYCATCAPPDTPNTKAEHRDGDGPNGRGDCYGYDAEHPAYDGEDYKCADCGAYLDDAD